MKSNPSFAKLTINVLRIVCGLLSIAVGMVWFYVAFDRIVFSYKYVYVGFVPEHYGLFPPDRTWARWTEFLTSVHLYFSLLVIIAGIGLVSLKRWGTYVAWAVYGLLLLTIVVAYL